MMIFTLVWLILFGILSWIVVVVSYWEKLIRTKEHYTREELIYFHEIFRIQLEKMNPGHSMMGYMAFLCGGLIAWFLTLIGGMVSPDRGPEPDFASGEMANYFFQSVLFVAMLHLVWPSLRQYWEDSFAPDWVLKFFEHDKSFFTGLSITLVSISLASWGVYHQISFLFVLINGVVLLTYASYQIQKKFPYSEENQSEYHSSSGESTEKEQEENTENTKEELEI